MLGIGVAVGFVALVFVYVLPRIAGYTQVWRLVAALPAVWLAALAAVSVFNLVISAAPLLAALPGVRARSALRISLAAGALSIVAPGGAALAVVAQVGMLRRLGFERRPIAAAQALLNMWGQLASTVFPVAAFAALAAEGGHSATLEAVAAVGLVASVALGAATAIGLASDRLARLIGEVAGASAARALRVLGRTTGSGGGEAFVAVRRETVNLLRHRWVVLTLATFVNQFAVFSVLVVALRGLGVPASAVSVVEAFAAWTIIRMLGKLPITPGGLGVEEVALVGALIGFGAGHAQAVSVTLVYRFCTVVPALVVGAAIATSSRVRRR